MEVISQNFALYGTKEIRMRKMSTHGVSVIHNPVKGTFAKFDCGLKRHILQKSLQTKGKYIKRFTVSFSFGPFCQRTATGRLLP